MSAGSVAEDGENYVVSCKKGQRLCPLWFTWTGRCQERCLQATLVCALTAQFTWQLKRMFLSFRNSKNRLFKGRELLESTCGCYVCVCVVFLSGFWNINCLLLALPIDIQSSTDQPQRSVLVNRPKPAAHWTGLWALHSLEPLELRWKEQSEKLVEIVIAKPPTSTEPIVKFHNSPRILQRTLVHTISQLQKQLPECGHEFRSVGP